MPEYPVKAVAHFVRSHPKQEAEMSNRSKEPRKDPVAELSDDEVEAEFNGMIRDLEAHEVTRPANSQQTKSDAS